MKPIVYLDTLFLLNFFVNCILLYITSVVIKQKITLKKMTTSGAISAIYSSLAFFSEFKVIFNFFSKILFSIFLMSITFGKKKINKIVKSLVVFYFSSFCFAGTICAFLYSAKPQNSLSFLISNGTIYIHINLLGLLLCFSASYIIIILFTKFCIKNYKIDSLKIELEITLNGNKNRVLAIQDTGNTLFEPISQLPVIVVEFDAISKMLPEKIIKIYQKNIDEKRLKTQPELIESMNNLMKKLEQEEPICYIIPFCTISENGILIGFAPDELKIFKNHQNNIIENVIIGLSELEISENYQALLHPDVLEKFN